MWQKQAAEVSQEPDDAKKAAFLIQLTIIEALKDQLAFAVEHFPEVIQFVVVMIHAAGVDPRTKPAISCNTSVLPAFMVSR
ncbi:MAG TPA: hypothetical protein VJR30_12530 [Bradyrhizobium sp.]|nr:hypothetical protein [Bradyrhizobium sp.]